MSLLREPGTLVGVGSPKQILADGGAPAVLAVHGFGGTPAEVALVTDAARRLGLRHHAPLLPGHGTSPADLATRTLRDWTAAVETALDTASPGGEPAVVAGLSLGSVLALRVAITHPERVRGLILLANAVWLAAPMPAWALALVARLGAPDLQIPKSGPDITDPIARDSHLNYDTQPLRAAAEVWRAGRSVRPDLGRVQCPVLIVHGQRDRVCPVTNARRVAARVASTDKQVVVLPRSAHIVTRDVDRAELSERVTAFLRRMTCT